jgi:geranylgeranyl pyrophosphate synthase
VRDLTAASNRAPADRERGAAVSVVQQAPAMHCPPVRILRDRLRAMAADLVSAWRAEGVPAAVRSKAGLRASAETLVRRAAAAPEHVGWTMVVIVSEYWRGRLAAASSGRRLVLLPDCPVAVRDGLAMTGPAAAVPQICGPGCGIATIWAAARDEGWVVERVERATSGIGALLTGQYDGVLGIAKLSHLEKAFAMLPAFSLPVAAVPCEPFDTLPPQAGCAESLAAAGIDVEWVLGLLGVAGGAAAPVGDYLPLLREAAEMFAPGQLDALAGRLGLGDALGGDAAGPEEMQGVPPLSATAAMSTGFLTRGGKFLRPFICLAAHDALRADLAGSRAGEPAAAAGTSLPRDAVKAAAVAIEIFHKASLVHDDIEDADVSRYGRPTLHMQYGIPAAINAGDYLLGLGYRLIAGLPGADAAVIRDLVGILADAHVRLAQGQGAELWWRDGGDKRLTPDEALAIYGLKTSPAFEAAVAMGIRLAGRQPDEVGAIGAYALHVGTGFQILNDLKDWAGDVENDRRAAGDLLGGRPTVMWALANERLPAGAVLRLRELAATAAGHQAGGPAAEEDIGRAIGEVKSLYDQAGVFDRATALVAEQRRLAAAAVATCRWPRLREVLEFLLDLAVPEPAASWLAE